MLSRRDRERVLRDLGGTLVVDDASHKQEVQQALHNGTLSFGFSAGGCLFPYYIGVAGGLMDAGILTADVKLGGASAGSLLATCIKSGMTLDAIVEQNQRLMADLRQGGTRGRMGPVLRAFLDANLPEDAHIACSGKAYVAVTRVAPLARPVLVSAYADRADLIQALMTSCHIPWYLDGNPFTVFRGERHCDGGLTNFIPLPPGTVGVRVCCFPSQQLSPVYRIGISPDSFEPWSYSLRQMVQWAFEPAEEAVVADLIDKGRKDANTWIATMELTGERQAAAEMQRQQQQGMGQVASARASAGAGGEQQTGTLLGGRAQLAVAADAADAQRGLQVTQAGDSGAGWQTEEAAELALQEAEVEAGQEGNVWAKAMGAAGLAASAAAVAAAVTASGGSGL